MELSSRTQKILDNQGEMTAKAIISLYTYQIENCESMNIYLWFETISTNSIEEIDKKYKDTIAKYSKEELDQRMELAKTHHKLLSFGEN